MAEGRKHRLSFKQLRLLFARGILRGRGTGKNRKVEYTKGATGNGASAPAKRDHSATRAARVAAGDRIAKSDATFKKLTDAMAPGGKVRTMANDPAKRVQAIELARKIQGARSVIDTHRKYGTPEQRQARADALNKAMAESRAREATQQRDLRAASRRAKELRDRGPTYRTVGTDGKPTFETVASKPKPARKAARRSRNGGPTYSGPTREQDAAYQRTAAPRYVADVKAKAQALATRLRGKGSDQASLFGETNLMQQRAASRQRAVARVLKGKSAGWSPKEERAYTYAMAYRLLAKGR